MTESLTELQLDSENFDALLKNIDELSEDELSRLATELEEYETRQVREAARDDLIEFCKFMDPDYIVGKHHRMLADMLMASERGDKDRIGVNIPPRHGKSHLVSTMFPVWFLGRNPKKKLMLVSHTTDLAVDFGRKVRNILNSPRFREIFPDVGLAIDSKSAQRWNTNQGGEFYACGVGSSIAGRGADLLVVDDPHSEQDVLNGNFEVFEKAYQWFTFGARTRLMPGGRVAVVHCMAGDTGVLMADGTERPLRDVRPGDKVASYCEGELVASEVLNWANQGPDRCFTIKTTSHSVLKANARHPFLVARDGVYTWVKVRELRPGDSLVLLKDAAGRGEQKPSPLHVGHADQKRRTTKNTLKRLIARLGIMGNTAAKSAHSATAPLIVKGCAKATTTSSGGAKGCTEGRQRATAKPTSSIGMGLRWKSTIRYLLSRAASALSANSPPLPTILGLTGTGSSAWTTAMTRAGFADSCATTVTSLSDMQRPQQSQMLLPSTSRFTTTQITSVEETHTEDVYDVQIARTENFIANGIPSHNTRWHQEDLTGRLVEDMGKNKRADKYEIVEFPAILEVERDNKIVQKPLWPEFFDLEALLRTKASMPDFQWNAQYQQNPTSEEGAIVKREWWNIWAKDDPPDCEYVIMSLDTAQEVKTRADFTAITTWGVFFNEEANAYNIILLNCIKERYEFPELKAKAFQEHKDWEPDAFIVEKKSSGVALYQELRRTGLPVSEYTPHRGTGDKLARLNSVSDIVASGLCWVPRTRWAEEVVEEIAGFPFMKNDDLVDSTVMALIRFRQGGFISLPSDEEEEEILRYRRKGGYY